MVALSPLKEHLNAICKIGQGAACCKYLWAGGKGFECMKVDEGSKKIIDENWAKVHHVAQGDNCGGIKELWLLGLKEK
jgi:hypothetical protein